MSESKCEPNPQNPEVQKFLKLFERLLEGAPTRREINKRGIFSRFEWDSREARFREDDPERLKGLYRNPLYSTYVIRYDSDTEWVTPVNRFRGIRQVVRPAHYTFAVHDHKFRDPKIQPLEAARYSFYPNSDFEGLDVRWMDNPSPMLSQVDKGFFENDLHRALELKEG
jgi:hypothetical protein